MFTQELAQVRLRTLLTMYLYGHSDLIILQIGTSYNKDDDNKKYIA